VVAVVETERLVVQSKTIYSQAKYFPLSKEIIFTDNSNIFYLPLALLLVDDDVTIGFFFSSSSFFANESEEA
jgi:hypothetical protein